MKFAPFFIIGLLAFSAPHAKAQTAPTPSPTNSPTPLPTPSLTIFDDAADATNADAANAEAANADAANVDSTVVSNLPPAPETAPAAIAPAAVAPAVIAPPSTPIPSPTLTPASAPVPTQIEKQLSAPRAVSKATPPAHRVLEAPQIATLPPQDEWLRADTSLNAAASRLGLSLPLPQARVVVWKSKRRLELWSGQTLVKVYRVALGNNPNGAKQRQHDSRTPEGHFYICTRNSKTSAFHVFLGLSYPGIPDAQRGKKTGLISAREYAMIRNRLASRGAPLWETRLGGWVGIHGGTDKNYAKKQMSKRGRADWTAGCIAVTNREIEEIHRATVLGTPVWVRP